MSIHLNVRKDEPVKDGAHKAVLKGLEKKDTTFGERLMWLFEVSEHNAEVAGFTSLSESTQAKAYLWATALNEGIRSRSSWSSEDVVGKGCILDLTTVEDQRGRKTNRILQVRPL